MHEGFFKLTRFYEIFLCGSLQRESKSVNAPFRNFSRRDCSVKDSCVRAIQRIHLLALPAVLMVACCVLFALSGCGGAAIVGTSAQAGSLSASTSLVTFGSVVVGQMESSMVSLSNTGPVAVQVTQVNVAGQAFAVGGANNVPVSIPPHGTYNMSVTFSPQATGASSGQLTIASKAFSSGTSVIGLSGTGMIAPPPIALTALSCTNSSMTGAGTDQCTVALSTAAASGGFAVSLASSNNAVTLPTALTVPAGASSVSFAATVSSFSSAQTVTLTASGGGVAETFDLALNVPVQTGAAQPLLSGFTCTTGSISAAGTNNCTLTLNTAAPSGGFVLNLSTDNSLVTVPATVTVPEDASNATFTATISSFSSSQTVTLSASGGGATETFPLQLNAAAQSSSTGPILSVSASTLTFGNVNLNTPSTQSITLTSTGSAAVSVSGATVSGSGLTLSGLSLPLTLNPNQTATLSVQFDPTTAGAVSGTLTIASNSSTGAATGISLSGTGVTGSSSGSDEVDLSWDAPNSSPDPVAGYNVYRSPSGASAYQQLNSSVLTGTTYTDLTVQPGQSYDYIVESVDASGVESAPSNLATAAIP
jgi:hypothetical protein